MPDPDANEPTIDPRLLRLRVELFTAMQTLTGVNLKEFEQLIFDVSQCMRPRPAGIDSGVALQVRAEQKTYGSVIVELRRKLLEHATKLLDAGNYAEAAMLVDTHSRTQ